MNNLRRKQIKKAIKMLGNGFTYNDYDAIDYGRDIIVDVLNEEQYFYDNIPESLQYTNRAEKSYEAIELLEETSDVIKWITETNFINEKETIDKVIDILKQIL